MTSDIQTPDNGQCPSDPPSTNTNHRDSPADKVTLRRVLHVHSQIQMKMILTVIDSCTVRTYL